MSVNKTFAGTVYSIPNTRGESGWETQLSQYLQDLADKAGTNIFLKQAVRKATTTPVTVSASTDCTIIVDLTGPGASTVNLPAGADKQIFIIVDGKGDASTNNITIDANGSETIEGSLTKVIRLNRECLVLQYSASAGDWKVVGGYVPNMIGGPASAVDNAIARFDGITGKVVQNSSATIDDSGAVTLGPSSFSGVHNINGVVRVVVPGATTGGFRLSGASSESHLQFLGTNASTNGSLRFYSYRSDLSNELDVGLISGSGAWTLGPSGHTGAHTINGNGNSIVATSGNNLVLKKSTGAAMAWQDDASASGTANRSIDNNSGTMRFYNHSGTIDGTVSQTGAWTFGTSSGTTEFGHSMTGYRTTATTSVLYIRNRETTTASDDAYDIICNKGSTTNTSSQGFIAFYVNDGGTPSGHITANGAGAATFNAFSDLRLKENVQPLQGELLKILSLNPVEFDYKDGSGHQIGFIAQEVEQVYPDTINVLGETEKMKTIAGWDKTSARLVKAIQEQQAIIDGLKARIEALESGN